MAGEDKRASWQTFCIQFVSRGSQLSTLSLIDCCYSHDISQLCISSFYVANFSSVYDTLKGVFADLGTTGNKLYYLLLGK
jgi:hypothetical protein